MTFKKLLAAIAVTASLCLPVTALATTSNYTTYSSGQTLTAASLNSLQTNYTNADNAILDGDIFTGNMLWYSGVDALFYSDAGTTLKAGIDSATGASILGLTQEGQMTNCGVTVSGTTITIAGYDGTALSATNPCVVAIRASTAGQIALAYFTANISTTFGAASDTDGNLFGITDADWASTMPLFLGVVNGNTTPYFVISRLPYVQTGAAATALCQKTDTDCDAQLDMYAMTTGLTLANEVNKPVTQVGWFDATYATTGGAWTFAVTGKEGFNSNYESVAFTFPKLQNGATLNYLSKGGAATTLAFEGTASSMTYEVGKNGIITIHFSSGTRSASDAGATAAYLHLPFAPSVTETVFGGRLLANAVGYLETFSFVANSAFVSMNGLTNSQTLVNFLCSDFANANDIIYGGTGGAVARLKAF